MKSIKELIAESTKIKGGAGYTTQMLRQAQVYHEEQMNKVDIEVISKLCQDISQKDKEIFLTQQQTAEEIFKVLEEEDLKDYEEKECSGGNHIILGNVQYNRIKEQFIPLQSNGSVKDIGVTEPEDMDAPCIVCCKKEEVDSGMCEDCIKDAINHIHSPQTKPDRVKSDNSRREISNESTVSVRRDKPADTNIPIGEQTSQEAKPDSSNIAGGASHSGAPPYFISKADVKKAIDELGSFCGFKEKEFLFKKLGISEET